MAFAARTGFVVGMQKSGRMSDVLTLRYSAFAVATPDPAPPTLLLTKMEEESYQPRR